MTEKAESYPLEVRLGGKPIEQGTAWFLKQNLVVTAFHVVGNREAQNWTHDRPNYEQAEYCLLVDNCSFVLEPLCFDVAADVALLKCEPTHNATPLPLATVIPLNAQWSAPGYPGFLQGKGFTLTGRITALGDNLRNNSIQLLVDQRTEMTWAGVSGSPVQTVDGVVGVITQEIGQVDTVWAATVMAVQRLELRYRASLLSSHADITQQGLVHGIDSLYDLADHIAQDLPGSVDAMDLRESAKKWVRQTRKDTVPEELLDQLRTYGVSPISQGAPPVYPHPWDDFAKLFSAYAKEPFGGRHDTLAKLDEFVKSANESAKGTYFFVTGESGFGKTALLAHWISSIRVKAAHLIFHFINSKFIGGQDALSCFRSLCEQLLATHALGGTLPEHPQRLQRLFALLLRLPLPPDERLVVVIDGLDEALLQWTPGPEIFPQNIVTNARVIFSARYTADRNWLKDLGLTLDQNHIGDLGQLTTEEVGDIIAKSDGFDSKLHDLDQLRRNVFTITNGDPFYVQDVLYHLKQRNWNEKSLESLPPKHSAYFREWWKEAYKRAEEKNSQKAFEDLMGTLSMALGPLGRDELVSISLEDDLRQANIDLLLEQVARYIGGDANAGYWIKHNRIRRFVQHMVRERLATYLSRIIDFCLGWREHKSVYALSNYPAHLFELDRRDELFALINKDWMEAQFERVRSHSAFSADVDLAIEAAIKTITPASFVQIVRNSLVYATLGSLAIKVPIAALAVLAQLGESDRAMAYARLIPEQHKKIEAFCLISMALARRNQISEARAILEQATGAADTIESWHYGPMEPGHSGGPLLAEIASAEMKLGNTHRAVALAERAVALARDVPGGPRDAVLEIVAHRLAEAELIDQAISAEEAIDDMQHRAAPLAAVLRALVLTGQEGRAQDLCEGLSAEWDQILELVELVEALAQAGQQERAAQASDRAASIAKGASTRWFKALLMAQAARASSRAQKNDQAIELLTEAEAMAKQTDDPLQRAWALAGVARALAKTGKIEWALRIAASIRDTETAPSVQRAEGRALWEVAKSLARAGDSKRALTLAARSQELLQALHDTGNTPIEYILPELDDINNSLGNSTPLIEVIRIIADIGDVDSALAAIEDICSRADRDAAHNQVIEALVGAGQLDRALTMTSEIEDTTVRAETIARVAEAMAHNRHDSMATKAANLALKEAQAVEDPWTATWAAVDLANTLAGAGQMDQALRVAKGISDAEARAWALVDVGKALAKAGDRERTCEVIDQALEAADSIEAPWALSSLIRSRAAIRPDTEKIRMQVVKRRDAISPGAERAIEAGAVIGSLTVKDQAQVKALMLPEIVRVLALIGEIERAAEIVDRIVVQALATGNSEKLADRNLILAQGAGALARLGKAEAACQAAEAISNPWRAAPALAAVAVAFYRTEQEEQTAATTVRAVSALQQLGDTAYHSELWANVVTTVAQAGQIERVLKQINDNDSIVRAVLGQRHALDTLVQVLLQSGDSDRAAEMIDRAVTIAAGNANHLAELILVLHRAGRHERVVETMSQAEAAADLISDPHAKAECLLRLAKVFVEIRAHQHAIKAVRLAMKAAKRIDDPRRRSLMEVNATRILADIGQVDQALEAADAITSPTFNTTALLQVLVTVNEAGGKERAVELAHRIADVAATIENPTDRAQAFVTAARALGVVGLGERAALALVEAVLSARFTDRSNLFRTLQESVLLLASIDECQTLWEIHQSLVEVDGWWSTT
jgi:tetratricopeptide (TPR) repeat protein